MKPLSVLFLFLFFTNFVYPQITFQRSYQIGQTSYGCTVVQTPDGGFAVCGVQINPSSHKIFLMKTDAFGDSLWTKYYEGEVTELDHVMHLTPDGGFVICGYRIQQVLLIRTDSKGDTIWEKILGSGYGVSVELANDHGYVVAGDSSQHTRLIKTDSAGNIQWSKTFAIPNYGISGKTAEPKDLKSTSDGGFVVTGRCHINLYAMSTIDVFLIKTNSSGDSIWGKIYSEGYPFVYFIYSIDETTDHGFILGGDRFYQPGKYSWDSYYGLLIRTDSMGESLWTKLTYDSSAYFNSVLSLQSGEFITAGASADHYIDEESGLLEHYTNAGDTIWTRKYLLDNSYLNSVSACSDEGFIMCGYNYDNNDSYLIKTDMLGLVYPFGIEERNDPDGISIFPNPTSGNFIVKSEFPIQSFEILSSMGTSVLKKEGLRNSGEITSDLTGFPAGIYFLKMNSEKGVVVKKVVLR